MWMITPHIISVMRKLVPLNEWTLLAMLGLQDISQFGWAFLPIILMFLQVAAGLVWEFTRCFAAIIGWRYLFFNGLSFSLLHRKILKVQFLGLSKLIWRIFLGNIPLLSCSCMLTNSTSCTIILLGVKVPYKTSTRRCEFILHLLIHRGVTSATRYILKRLPLRELFWRLVNIGILNICMLKYWWSALKSVTLLAWASVVRNGNRCVDWTNLAGWLLLPVHLSLGPFSPWVCQMGILDISWRPSSTFLARLSIEVLKMLVWITWICDNFYILWW